MSIPDDFKFCDARRMDQPILTAYGRADGNYLVLDPVGQYAAEIVAPDRVRTYLAKEIWVKQ